MLINSVLDPIHVGRGLYFIASITLLLLAVFIYYLKENGLLIISITLVDIIIFSFVAFIFGNHFLRGGDYNQIMIWVWLGLISVYLFFKAKFDWMIHNGLVYIVTILVWGQIILVLFQLIFSDLDGISYYLLMRGTFINPGPLCVYLMFSLSFMYVFLDKIPRWVFWVTFFVVTIIVFVSQTRIAWIQWAFLMLYLSIHYFKLSIKKYGLHIVIALLVFLPIAIYGMFQLKPDSVLGRFFIYDRCFEMIMHALYTGVGFEQFNVAFTQNQANYFVLKGWSHPNIYRADSNQYAFNEFLHFGVELGVLGLLLLLGLFIYGYYLVFRKRHGYLILFLSMVIVAMMFSYPLHELGSMIYIIMFLGILSREDNAVRDIQVNKIPLMMIIFAFSLGLAWWTGVRFQNEKLWKKGFLSFSHNKKEALDYYKQVDTYFKRNGFFLHNYAGLLQRHNDFESSYHKYEEAKLYIGDADIYFNQAMNAVKLGDYSTAENNYKRSIDILPFRFIPRFHLFQLYLSEGRFSEAQRLAEKTIDLTPKIDSEQVQMVKKEMLNFLKTQP